ncbi:MAG: hypothetical protein HP024_02585 [Acholeplasmatales bacterium]|nr:hypothetical protein [Acholeplasmatales bacterium]
MNLASWIVLGILILIAVAASIIYFKTKGKCSCCDGKCSCCRKNHND